jgi:RimJ/RimL family protein N-acetyltransferase
LDYAFGYLNFHRVSIGVVGFNKRTLRFWEKAGFKREVFSGKVTTITTVTMTL